MHDVEASAIAAARSHVLQQLRKAGAPEDAIEFHRVYAVPPLYREVTIDVVFFDKDNPAKRIKAWYSLRSHDVRTIIVDSESMPMNE